MREAHEPNLAEHVAVKAWRKLWPKCGEPDEIRVLKKEKKGGVYQLRGVGPAGSAIIAKQCKRAIALVEHTIYAEILPAAPISSVRYYGYLEEPNGKFCWLFLEDAGAEQYSRDIKEHRALAAEWLGLLHTSMARNTVAAELPNRGPRWYLEHLRSAREIILRSRTNPTLASDDLVTLKSVVSQYEFLESRWHDLEQCCEGIESTLVHGDFSPKNMRVRAGKTGIVLLPFDWEMSGWAVPAADLAADLHVDLKDTDLTTYWSTVREHWPNLDRSTLERLVIAGRIFRLLASIHWDSYNLPTQWPQKNMQNLNYYKIQMTHAILTLYGRLCG